MLKEHMMSVGKSFDDDSEFQQFLKSPQWWKEISDFDCRDV